LGAGKFSLSLIQNEQAKLTATYLNGIGIALAAVGGIATWVTFLLNPPRQACCWSPGSAQFVFAYQSPYILSRGTS
jgi:hypothetical protein